jgi:transcriptional regulator with GAF, ATPase, and Fis domain
MYDIVNQFRHETDLGDTLAAITGAAVDLIDGVDYADVLMITDGEFRSVKPTTPMVVELDQLQQQVGEGPCLEAAMSDSVVRCRNLAADERWPRFAAGAIAHGVHSMLSFHLYTYNKGAGALNLFSRRPQTLDAESEAIGAMLATQAAIAIIASDRHNQYQSAVASRDLIGQAKGIIMERFKIDATSAFEMMRKLSQDGNEKVTQIAQRIVDTR